MDFSHSLWISVGISQAICLLNVLAGLSIARKTFHKRFEKFIGIVIGSMIVRIVITAILVWACISILHVHILSFAISFCIGTFIFLFVEIFYFHKLADSPAIVQKKNALSSSDN